MKLFAFIIFLGAFSYLGLAQETPQTASTKPGKSAKQSKETSRSTASNSSDEKVSWEKVLVLSDPASRAKATRAYLEKFPDSTFHSQAVDLLVRSEIEEGHRRLQDEDLQGAVSRFVAGLTAAPTPIDDKLYSEIFSKLPEKLYFSGTPEQSFRIADILESKIQNNADQMLTLANFYLSVEQGTKALSLAETALKIKPDSAAAYLTHGLASRVDFQIEQSAASYEKALHIDPDSDTARRGLAEMKRALGKADEAVQLFGEILSKDPSNAAAKTGQILSMLDAGKLSDAESELTKFLSDNPRNVLLLAGAAYWYATHEKGEKAVELARKAIDSDPRFIWSHIALARGLLLLGKPYEAEKTLLAARRYGNFPTLQYEIATVRLSAGFFRDAAEEISKSFTVSDGTLSTKLGGRIVRSSKNFSDLVGLERQASIFIPNGSRNSESDRQLSSLLELKQLADSPKPDADAALKAIDQFVDGSDSMKLYRQLYSAGLLLDKNIALEKAAEIAQGSTAYVETGLDSPYSRSATLASELYEARSIAVARGEYLNVPDVPRGTLSAIVRGRIEEINGWARFQMGEPAAAAIRLKRAVNILPPNSAWSQSASWRLGSALAISGKEAEALDVFIKAYKASGVTDAFRYETIAALYRKVHGNIDDLQAVIGPDPRPPLIESKEVLTDTVETEGKGKVDGAVEKPVPATYDTAAPAQSDAPPPTPIPTPTVSEKAADPEVKPNTVNEPQPTIPKESTLPLKSTDPVGQKEASKTFNDLFPPVVITIPLPKTKPLVSKAIPYLPNPALDLTPGETKEPVENKETDPPPAAENRQGEVSAKLKDQTVNPVATNKDPANVETTPCTITASEESITLLSESGGRAVIVGIDDETSLDGIKGVSLSPEHVSVKREPITGIQTRALFVIKSESSLPGIYQVNFELPCGKKTIVVRVR